MNLKDDSQDSRNSDLLHLEDDLSKDLQEIIALEKIKSAPKSRKRGVTEYTYGSSGHVYSNPPRPRSKQKNMSRKEFSGADREYTSEHGSYTGIIASVLIMVSYPPCRFATLSLQQNHLKQIHWQKVGMILATALQNLLLVLTEVSC